MKPPYNKPLTASQLASIGEKQIDYSDILELDDDFWNSAKVIVPESKRNISLRVADDVIEFFKKDNPKGYTSRMAAVLSAYVDARQRNS